MTVDDNGNGTAVVYSQTFEEWELEHKLRRATEKVMNSQTKINTINLKNYIDKKVVVYHRNLKKVEGYIRYNNRFPDYPYKFNDRCYTKNGKILIDNENGWDICGIFPTTEEIDPSRILKDNDFIWYMGEKYQKVEEPKPKVRTLYDICVEWCDDDNDPPVSALIDKIEKEWTPLNLNQKENRGFTDGYSMGFDDALNMVRKTLR